jgi:hypothetical protein
LWWLLAHLIIPAINAEVTIRDVLKLGVVKRTAVGCQLATEIRIIIWAGLVEGGDIAVATTPLAVSLGIVSVEVVAAGESSVAARHPAYVGLLLGMALHMTLEVLLTLKAAFAPRLLALELDLLDDCGKILQAQVGPQQLLFGWLASRLTVCANHLCKLETLGTLLDTRYGRTCGYWACHCPVCPGTWIAPG